MTGQSRLEPGFTVHMDISWNTVPANTTVLDHPLSARIVAEYLYIDKDFVIFLLIESVFKYIPVQLYYIFFNYISLQILKDY